MAHARKNSMWDHTSAIMCMIANSNRDTKKHPKPFEPNEFHPGYMTQLKSKKAKNQPVSTWNELGETLKGLYGK